MSTVDVKDLYLFSLHDNYLTVERLSHMFSS